MEFATPGWLVLLLVLPALVLLRRRHQRAVLVPGTQELRVAPSPLARFAAAGPLILRLIVLGLLIVALARPRTAGGVIETDTSGIPIVIALDVSSSMLAPEGDGTRLSTAKAAIGTFFDARQDDPVGLVAFAAEAITLVPVTTHQPLLHAALESARPGLLEDGTAIGEGLATAVNRLRRTAGEDRVVILLSDGASNRGATGPLIAAGAAAEFGIRVYTIGFGDAGRPESGPRESDDTIAPAEAATAVDEPLMREIARATGGEYHRAGDAEALGGIYARIDQLERSPFEQRRTVLYREWYLWLIALAAAALGLEWVLRSSRWGAVPS